MRDQANRDANAQELLRYGDENGHQWADLFDILSMYPDVRRGVVRWLTEIDASSA